VAGYISSFAISIGAFALAFGGALLGVFLGSRLPKHHLSDENKEVVRLAMALVGTLTGMALGLLIDSAKTYDIQSNELTQASANVALLGNLLRFYGPEAYEAQDSLRLAVERVLAENWPNERAENWKLSTKAAHTQEIYEQLRALAPRDEERRMMQSEVLGLLKNLAQLHWLIIAQNATTILQPLLFVMIFSMMSIFVSWGMFSHANTMSVTTYFVVALCVSSAIFLILELYTPYNGLLRLSSAPLRTVYDSLARYPTFRS
jgi:Protein of unknown function (DUF4239)